jgi:hypothetical protein
MFVYTIILREFDINFSYSSGRIQDKKKFYKHVDTNINN